MCAKNHLLIFGSFLDIWENVEWPRFWTTLYTSSCTVCVSCHGISQNCLVCRATSANQSSRFLFRLLRYHRCVVRQK